jgi:hypothetical protein
VFPKLVEVKPLEDYKLRLRFNDGAEGTFDFAGVVGFHGMFEKLRDPVFFSRARISRDVWKTLEWPGEIDLDPVVLYSDVTGKSIEWIRNAPEPEPKKAPRKTAKKATVYA